jgi:nucleoside-diphosphate kinase
MRHPAAPVDMPWAPGGAGGGPAGRGRPHPPAGPRAVQVVRTMMGPTNGRDAPPGTIRGDYGVSRQMNLIHGSDGPDVAKREIEIYFRPDELLDYEATLGGWVCAPDER